MGAVTVLGIIAIVSGVLFAALGMLPGASAQPSNAPTPKADMQQVGKRFDSTYANVIDDLMSYSNGNPDLQSAQQKQQQMSNSAAGIAGQFQNLADNLQQQQDALQKQADQTASQPAGDQGQVP